MKTHHCATNLVFSYQNVTVILSSKTKCFHSIYARPPPTFLFLPSSIVKKQTDQNPSKIHHRPTLKSGNKTSIAANFKRFPRTKDFVASSAAALVSERMYRFASPSSQQPSSRKSEEIDKQLKLQGFSNAAYLTARGPQRLTPLLPQNTVQSPPLAPLSDRAMSPRIGACPRVRVRVPRNFHICLILRRSSAAI